MFAFAAPTLAPARFPSRTPESASKDASAFTFQPPSGGDITLKSSDGTIFVAHSMLLALASPIFADMFAGAKTAASGPPATLIPDTIELAEDAEAVSLMLAFIYPVIRPTIDTLGLLEKAMAVAHKYEIDVLLKTLDQCRSENRKLVRLDPLRVFRLASDYGLRDTQALAAKLIGPAQYDMLTPEGIVQFAKEFPGSAHIIGLAGVQGARYKILETLFAETSSAFWPEVDSRLAGAHLYGFGDHRDLAQEVMACVNCWSAARVTRGGLMHYQPGWLPSWGKDCRATIMSGKPLDECNFLFRMSYLAELRTGGRVCTACIDQTFKQHARFDKWAADARRLLETELGKLDILYSL